jgi:hypothetical protein
MHMSNVICTNTQTVDKWSAEWLAYRLLARILKEGVQFWYNNTSTVRGGGVRENVPLENLWSLRYFISVSVPSFVQNFSNTLGFVSTEFVPLCFLLNYDIFIQPGTQSNWSKCQMYNNNENWSYFVSDILGKSLKIISLSPQNLGVQRCPFFVIWASQDAWMPFWLKACWHIWWLVKCRINIS